MRSLLLQGSLLPASTGQGQQRSENQAGAGGPPRLAKEDLLLGEEAPVMARRAALSLGRGAAAQGAGIHPS